MKKIRTNIYRRHYRDGREVWMIRWKDERTSSWKALKGGNTKDEAIIAEAQLREDLLKGVEPTLSQGPNRSETIGDLIDLFYKTPRFLARTWHGQRVLKSQLERSVRKELGQTKAFDLNRKRIVDYYLKLKAKGLSHSTIRKHHFLLCILGDVWTEQSSENINPARLIKDFHKLFPKQAPTRDINFLTPDEIDVLLKEARKSKSKLLYPFVKFLAHTGMRRSEALNLKWTDIDEKAGFIHIRTSKNGKPRTIPLEEGAREALDSLYRRTLYLFSGSTGQRYREGGFLKPFQNAAERAGIKKRVDLHTLRHAWGSNKIRQGWGLKKVSVMLGHSDISITARIYTHLLDGDLKVRDEFHVAKFFATENSGDRQGVQAKLNPEAIMAMIQMLQKQLNEQVSAKGAASVAAPGALTAEFGKIIADSTQSLNQGAQCYPNATQSLKSKKGLTVSSQSLSNFSNKSNQLSPVVYGGPDRARTCDLQIRSLTL